MGHEVLYEALLALGREDYAEVLERDYPTFNESLLHFLPKKSTGRTADGQDLYEPANVRPLSITNTSNRLIASAVRLALEPALAPYITIQQRGFLPGRSIIANILDIDEELITHEPDAEASSDTKRRCSVLVRSDGKRNSQIATH